MQTADQNYPNEIDENVAANLPGQIYDAHDQCYIHYGTSACDDVFIILLTISLLLLLH